MSPQDTRIVSMHPDWLECYNGRRHDFRWRGATVQIIRWETRRAERWTFICQRCPVERVDIRNPRNVREVWSRWYPHVEGYHAEPGEGRLDPGEVVAELARRARAHDWPDTYQREGAPRSL